MLIRFSICGLPFARLLVAAILAGCVPALAQQNDTPGAPSSVTLESIRQSLDRIEQEVRHQNAGDDALLRARTNLEPVRDALRAAMDVVERRLGEADTRLKQIGAPPPAGQPEDASIAAERQRLAQSRSEVDAVVKQARLLTLRTDELSELITERRRTIFTRDLFGRASSAFDPSFWVEAAGHVPAELRDLGRLMSFWWAYALDNGGYGSMAAACFTLAGLIGAGLALRRFLGRRVTLPTLSGTRFSKAAHSLVALLRHALTMPAVAVMIVLVLDGFGLFPPRMMTIGLGAIVACFIASFGRGVAVGLLAPDEPERRLVSISDGRARLMSQHVVWGGRIFAAIVFANIVHRALIANVSLTVATSMILAFATAALLGHLLFKAGRHAALTDDNGAGAWLRSAGWVLVVAIVVALASGYIGLATFLSGRFLVAAAVLGALYILLVLTDTLFTEVLTANTPRGRAVAAFFGIGPRSVELFGTLLSAVVRLLLVLVFLFPLLGPWGLFATDFVGVLKDAAFGFRIGDVTISLSAILSAVALLLAGGLVARAAQRWLQTRFLPRTNLDPSLQISVATIFGYVCTIALIGTALAAVGIDLQKITLVAGALSIGIGFGLQSVVSNFVSGLILLAERPIRVGDIINVKGEEGAVRRIHVRATEIETADRASVIVPNSELITGVVKNWTHANQLRRIVIKIGVAYDSDAERVREILLDIVKAHPNVLPSPEPLVLLTDFGDNGILFEASGVVRNIAEAGTAKSDIGFEILRRFRAEGIAIPYPTRHVIWRGEPPVTADS